MLNITLEMLFLIMKFWISTCRYTPTHDRRSPPGSNISAVGIYAVILADIRALWSLLADANELCRGAVTAGEL